RAANVSTVDRCDDEWELCAAAVGTRALWTFAAVAAVAAGLGACTSSTADVSAGPGGFTPPASGGSGVGDSNVQWTGGFAGTRPGASARSDGGTVATAGGASSSTLASAGGTGSSTMVSAGGASGSGSPSSGGLGGSGAVPGLADASVRP